MKVFPVPSNLSTFMSIKQAFSSPEKLGAGLKLRGLATLITKIAHARK